MTTVIHYTVVPGYIQTPRYPAYTDVDIRVPSSPPSRHIFRSRGHSARRSHRCTAGYIRVHGNLEDTATHSGLLHSRDYRSRCLSRDHRLMNARNIDSLADSRDRTYRLNTLYYKRTHIYRQTDRQTDRRTDWQIVNTGSQHLNLISVLRFYRAMHFSAYARSWDRMLSVRLCVCPSVCDVGGL